MIPFLPVLPWLVLVAALPFVLRRRPSLGDYPAGPTDADEAGAADAAAGPADPEGVPLVSIILPTRDDAHRVGACLATLLDSRYPAFEVIVADVGSRDGTREIVEVLAARTPARLRLIDVGRPPEGRPWRAWACERAYAEARGELLLFTEPGTTHESDLLGRAVAALEAERADLLSVIPRLVMEGFWERLVLPHIWLMHAARFPSAVLVNRSRSPRNAVASHQFLLFRRAAYDAIGGHGVVEHRSMEDLSLAQALVRSGRRLFLVHGEAFLETRMLRDFAAISEDWSGAVPPAARTTVVPWARVLAPWVVTILPLGLFVAPPVVLAIAWPVPGWPAVTGWAMATTLLSLLFWLVVYTWYRIRPAYAVAFPVGGLLTSVIFLRSLVSREGR